MYLVPVVLGATHVHRLLIKLDGLFVFVQRAQVTAASVIPSGQILTHIVIELVNHSDKLIEEGTPSLGIFLFQKQDRFSLRIILAERSPGCVPGPLYPPLQAKGIFEGRNAAGIIVQVFDNRFLAFPEHLFP